MTIILFAVFVALTLVVTYAFFILRDLREEKSVRIAGKLRFGTSVARKLTSVSLIGLIANPRGLVLHAVHLRTLPSVDEQRPAPAGDLPAH